MRRSELGASNIKAIPPLLFLFAVGYLAFKTVPVYVHNYQLNDFMRQEALRATVKRFPPEAVVEHVMAEARELGLPIQQRQIQVQASHNYVSISVDYSALVDLRVYQFHLHFTPSADNRGL